MEEEIKIDFYRLKEKIGQGETADVFLSIDTKKNKLVAIKRISREKLTENGINNLKRELNILHRIKHPNIISLKHFLKSTNHFNIILEYCNGGDLKKYMQDNQHPLNEFYIQKIIQQLAPAIEYMHTNNIIHRDLKLENILLNFDQYINVPTDGNLPPKIEFKDKSLNKTFTIKIADLGFSKDLMKDNSNSTIIGKKISAAISPEMINSEKTNKPYNTKTDLWSLGVITYELLTGSSPFIGETTQELFEEIQKGKYILPHDLKCSVEIISFINGLLQYYPEKRLNWEQIKSHPFLRTNPNDFKYIELELLSENEKKQIEINSKDSDNLLWILFKCKNLNFQIDKINHNEVQKSDVKKMINQSIVVNSEVIKASENEKKEREKENESIERMKAKYEKEIEKANLEKVNKQKEREKLINEENHIKNEKNNLIKKTEYENINEDEEEQKLENIELKLEKNKSDKKAIDDEIKNVDQKILEAQTKINLIQKTIERKKCIATATSEDKDLDSFNSFVIIKKEENEEYEWEIDDKVIDSDNENDIDFEDYIDEYEIDLDYINNKFSNPDY